MLDRELEHANQITKPVLDAYQRWLFHYRTPEGKPLAFSSQRFRLQKVKNFFRWLTKENVIPSNPASELEMPRIERRIPRAILSEREVEKVLALADLTDPVGLRDRVMMEVLYSTGIRRTELAGLDLFDIEPVRGVLTVRLGKGKKDRVVPIVHGAKLGKTGSCHIFRHSMATLMLEGGADVRLIQEILGHAELSTTAIYTRVSVRHLKRVEPRPPPHGEPRASSFKPSAKSRDHLIARRCRSPGPRGCNPRIEHREEVCVFIVVREARVELVAKPLTLLHWKRENGIEKFTCCHDPRLPRRPLVGDPRRQAS